MTNKYLYFWVYDDDIEPYLVVNPPKNFRKLLRQWKRLDDKLTTSDNAVPEWKPVNEWLELRGVTLIEPKSISLDNI